MRYSPFGAQGPFAMRHAVLSVCAEEGIPSGAAVWTGGGINMLNSHNIPTGGGIGSIVF
jgi:hypothetical protein